MLRPISGWNLLDWLCGCVLIYGALFGIGKIILKDYGTGCAFISVAAAAAGVIYWDPASRLVICHGVKNMSSRIFLMATLACALFAQQPLTLPTGEKLAPYYPTLKPLSAECSSSAELKAGEKMFDLGSGDGRIVIMAAQKYHADATGVELDSDLAQSSQAKLRQLGLQKTARIIYGDILKQNYSSANLITVYLLPESNIKVRPILEAQLKKGTRIVAHDFEVGGWTPVKTVAIPDDGEGRAHMLYLYVR